MSYWNEIVANFGCSPENFTGGFRINVFDGVGAYVEGHRGIVTYTDTEIVLRIKGASLAVKGEKLKLAGINRDEVYIVGKIISVERKTNG